MLDLRTSQGSQVASKWERRTKSSTRCFRASHHCPSALPARVSAHKSVHPDCAPSNLTPQDIQALRSLPFFPSKGSLQSLASHLTATAAALSLLISPILVSPPPAQAVLNSPNAAIARSADAALRRAIPAFNPEVKAIQADLEDIQYLLRIPQRKPYGSMASELASALKQFETRERLLDGVPPFNQAAAEEAADALFTSLKKLEQAVKSQQSDYIGVRVADALKKVAELELLEAPGLAFTLPKDYLTRPRLVGRAQVSLTVEAKDGALTFVDPVKGGLSRTGTIELTLDGYSAPLSAGNFLANVMDGKYDDRTMEASRTAVVIPSLPTTQAAPIPLEILPLGEFDPVYRVPLDVQGGELPVLPLSIAGAISMTHLPGSDSFLNGDEWFMYKFDKQQAGLAGLAFDEGTFGVFGYVTEGIDVATKLKSGDVIVKAAVKSGADKLVRPPPTSS